MTYMMQMNGGVGDLRWNVEVFADTDSDAIQRATQMLENDRTSKFLSGSIDLWRMKDEKRIYEFRFSEPALKGKKA